MRAELTLAIVWAITGWSIITLVGLDRRRHRGVAVLVAPLVGLCITTVTASLGLALGLGSHIELVAIVIVAILGVAVRTVTRPELTSWLTGMGASVTLAAATAGVIRGTVTPVLTFDSYRFIHFGRLLEADELDISSPGLADYPIVGVQVQAFGSALGAEFVIAAAAAAGVLGALGATAMIVGSNRTTQNRIGATIAIAAVAGASLALIFYVSYMLRLQLSYLNSHVMVAGLVSLAAVAALGRLDDDDHAAVTFLSAIALATLALARTEGALLAAIVMLAIASDDGLERATWKRLAVLSVLPAAFWYARLASGGASGDILSPERSAFMIVAMAAPMALLAIAQLDRIRRVAAWLGLIGLTVGLLGVSMLEPDVFAASAAAIASNMMTNGVWGPVWWLLGPALLCAVVFGPLLRREEAWLLIVGGFFALVLILGGVRDFPFRIGFGDSANRMLIHIVPLASAFVVTKVLAAAEPSEPAS